MESYAVFLDIDNTLYCDGAVPAANVRALREARSRGHYIFLNTARSFGMIPNGLMENLPLDGAVAGIGTDLRLRGEQIFHHVMPVDELKAIARHFEGQGREVGFEGETTTLWMYPKDHRGQDRLTRADEFDTVWRGVKISKLYIRGQLTPQEHALFSKKYTVFQHARYAEFVTKGFDKATGMRRMAEHLHIPVERCIAMGDSANDADMLRAAGISVAMGDAIDEIKQMCDYVSCDARDGGVAQAIEKFLLTQ